jgi:beta-lactamase class A
MPAVGSGAWRRAAFGLAGLLVFGLGVLAGVFALTDFEHRRCASRYAYINTVFACGVQPILGKGAYIDLRSRLLRHLEGEIAAGRLRDAGIFFRDLRNGPTFGINELSAFAPASLLKLPLVFAYLNGEESVPGLIKRTVTYDGGFTAPAQSIRPAVSIEAGREYTLETLLANTLVYSDNLSYLILRQYIRDTGDGEKLVEQTYRELGIIPPEGMTDHTVSVHGYASLFRQLHNATYLTPDLSELALSWLARSAFTEGLAAGVPPGIVVAHKFGERSAPDDETGSRVVEFHDCGIVYFPQNPYVLCVMTRGTDLDPLVETVRAISMRVYEAVAARRKAPTGASWNAASARPERP